MLIVGSPKKNKSTSEHCLTYIKDKCSPELEMEICTALDYTEETLHKILQADRIVIAFPLYVDGVPGHLLKFMRYLEENIKKQVSKIKLYCIVNCGFYEAIQNELAISIMHEWCKAADMEWGQAVAIGAGGMSHVAPLGKGPMENIGKALDSLAQAVKAGESNETLFAEPNFPRFLYIQAAHFGCKKQAKENGLRVSEIKRKPTIE